MFNLLIIIKGEVDRRISRQRLIRGVSEQSCTLTSGHHLQSNKKMYVIRLLFIAVLDEITADYYQSIPIFYHTCLFDQVSIVGTRLRGVASGQLLNPGRSFFYVIRPNIVHSTAFAHLSSFVAIGNDSVC